MKIRILSLIIVLFLVLSACNPLSPATTEKTVSPGENDALFHFIDVGQGDSILIQTKDTAILIDAGTEEGGISVFNYLRDIGIDYIDCFILTHPHDDHIGGSTKIIGGIDIGKVYLNGESSSSYSFEDLLDALIENNISAEVPSFDCVYKFGSLKLKFLTPRTVYENANDNSLVLMVEHGETKALFTGDAEKNVEAFLLDNADVKADILKVGHHGSRNASTDAFLRKVLPRVCVIQCGKDNSYGHPHTEVLDRIESINSEILRTDKLGTVVLRSNGKTVFDNNGNEFKEIHSDSIKKLIYIGNKKSKVFHAETCPNLPGEKNRVIFKLREDAVNRGYTPCSNCMP